MVDMKELARALWRDLMELLRPALDGSEDDLREYGRIITEDALRIVDGWAAADVPSHLQAQALLLAERMRIRINSGMLEWLTKALKLIANLALAAGENYLNSKIGG